MIIIPEGTSAQQQLFVYEHDAGRLELLVRILYWILISIVMGVYGMIAGLCPVIQWICILILGCRIETLSISSGDISSTMCMSCPTCTS